MWAKAARRPVDSFAILAAGAASIVIIVNAIFLQSGSHPAPFFVNPTRTAVSAENRPKPAESAAPKAAQPTSPTHSVATTPAPQPVAARRNDPIAELIGPSSRIMAVQRVLTEYGYGQIKPSGMLDNPTSTAIEKFEREHKLPVTGRISDHLIGDLAAMAGRPIE
jgi:Putative peptidoglycan binding domain